MASDMGEYLNESDRLQEDYAAKNNPQWVEDAYIRMKSAIYGILSDDRKWIEAEIPVPVASHRFDPHDDRYELLRRRFVMDGWVSAWFQSVANAPNPFLILRAPREAVFVQTTDGREITLEFQSKETVAHALPRFISSGGVYYASPWERVTIPPSQIAAIVQRSPGAA